MSKVTTLNNVRDLLKKDTAFTLKKDTLSFGTIISIIHKEFKYSTSSVIIKNQYQVEEFKQLTTTLETIDLTNIKDIDLLKTITNYLSKHSK